MLSKLSDYIDLSDLQSTIIPEEFGLDVQEQVNMIITHGIDDQAVSRKEVHGVSIDSAESKDLDDAIWAERTDNGYCVWVHIADVTEAIPIYSPIDLEALKRTTSIYGKDSVIPMIPAELSDGLLSLDTNGSDKKLTMTLQVDLNLQGIPQNYSFYESKFTNKKRYNYENFGEDFMSPDSENYEHLHLFKEIADKLRTIRSMNSGNIDYKEEEVSARYRYENGNGKTAANHICHDIIEAFMVMGNEMKGMHGASIGNKDNMYKLHDNLLKRSYYSYLVNPIHKGLGIVNYAHFTSPIRRYPDMINHRAIKAFLRGEKPMYHIEDIKFLAEHINNTRYKIDMIGGELDFHHRSIQAYNKMKDKTGTDPQAFDLKHHIRESVHKKYKLADIVNKALIDRITNGDIGEWAWLIGVVLLGKDTDVKEAIRTRIENDKILNPTKVISILGQTKILRGTDSVIEFQEEISDGGYVIECIYRGKVIGKGEANIKKKENDNISWKKHEARTKLVSNVLDYFIEEK